MTRRTQYVFKLAGLSIVFLALTILAALILRSALPSQLLDRGPASVSSEGVFEHRGNLTPQELGMLGSTPFLRGRRAVFNLESFRQTAGLRAGTAADNAPRSRLAHEKPVVLNLFPDVVLSAEIHEESAYMVNDGLYVGTISGDPDSTVRIMIQNGSVDGTIETKGLEYKIMDGGNKTVVITESRK